MKKLFGRSVLPVLVFNILFLFSITSFAQDLDDVSIGGKITDSNGLSIVGATVKATLVSTGIERTAVTNDDGRYKIIELSPGLYKVSATANGFGTKEKIDLETLSGQNVQLNFSLNPADVVVDPVQVVEEDASVVDTTRTIVGGTITQLEIEELPNNSRNPLDLVLTLGGTSEEALSVRDLAEDRNANPRVPPAEQGLFSLSGGASYSNNITIDGLDNNDDRSAGDRFQPSLESIAEVQVIKNQFSAEYGRASGGRVNLRTRGGTNKFRGRAFMFFRDDNLNSNSWYNNSRGIQRLPLTEYNPGFTFGGPILKNKTFFSVAYEYTNLQDTTFIDTYVPVGTNPNFTLPTSTGGTQGCDNSSPTACTTNPPTAGLIAPYQVSIPTPNYNHSFTARIDHQLFKNNDFTFGWQLGRRKNRRTTGASSTRIEDALQARSSDTDALNFTDNQIFGANLVNQFRMQWSVYEPNYQTDNPFDPVVLIGYRNPVTNSVQTLIAGNSTASTLQNFSSNRKETRWQFQDSITYLAGKHTIKAGLDIQYVNSEDLSLGDATGTFNFSSVLFYEQNNVTRFRQNFGTARDVTNTYWGVFANDEFKARPNLTISYGLRFERETAVSDQNNFGPRVGVAYSPWKDGKGVIRFGAGIFYNRTLLRTVGDFIQNNSGNLFQFDSNNIGTSGADTRRIAVLGAISQQFPDRFETVQDLKNLLTSVGQPDTLGFAASDLIRSVDPNLKIPESYQFNIGFEREIGKGFVFEANLTSNKTSHLWREYNPNLPVLPSGFGDWTDYLVANPYTFTNTNGTIRTYRFYLGATNDASGTATTQGGTTTCSTTANVTCFVNLNTVNSTTTFPSTAVSGSTTNSTGTPLGIALAAISRFRPDTSVGEKAVVSSIGNAYYKGLVLELRSRYRKLGYGFRSSLRAVYTLSSTKDDGLNNTSNAEIDGDFSREWARSLQDRRHRIAISGVFESPWWLGKVRFSPLFRFGSSAPFNLGYGVDRNLNDSSTDRPIFTGNIDDIKWREPGSPFPTTLASQFSLPPIGSTSGTLPRNSGKGPSFYTFDLSLTREWKFGERFKLRPTIQFDNILNAAVFSFGSEFIDFTALSNNPTATQLANYQSFLIPTRTYRQRQIRVGIRFDF
jgi:hypothetical protein